MKHRLTIVLTLILALVMVIPGSAKMIQQGDNLVSASAKEGLTGNYIVQMTAAPVIDYAGGVRGLRATASSGTKINVTSPDVQKYVAFLDKSHADVAARVGGQKLYDYRYTFNGFAAKLTPAQAEAMKLQAGVASVEADAIHYADTVTTPEMLGLSTPGGVWDTIGGMPMAGRNIVIGDIDSGITPEFGSFAYQPNLGPRPFERWTGKCQLGEAWDSADLCNGKIIGARFYNEGWGGDTWMDANRPWEFNSARDYNGHGTHTASTAAGNWGVDAILPDGTNLGKMSGMAPQARIAVYKALWSLEDGSTANGTTVDLLAAIDQAVADGVDVINYSISGSQTSVTDTIEMAFMRAARSGVFVSASAGNSGPTASTVAHNSPWLTTVAAGTHDRAYMADVILGNGAKYSGISVGTGTPVAPLILATAAALPGADPTAARLCFSTSWNGGVPVLDPALVAGKIVVCDRGTNDRVNKSLAVKEAGGIGVVLANTSPNTLNADLHSVPTVHVDEIAGAAIKAYATADPAPTAQLTPAVAKRGLDAGVIAPDVASFSSRGPARSTAGNLLKPDIMAPGVDVLAGVAPSYQPSSVAFYSGTSMAAPHIAGIAALLKQFHPDWSVMAIKSALMTTATQVRNNGTPIAGGLFAYGAGWVQPFPALDPGLVYDSGLKDWVAFLCGQGAIADARCPLVAINASDLNVPSIAISAMAGSQTVTRRVTSVAKAVETYTPSVVGLAGIDVTFNAASYTVAPRQTVSYMATFTRNGAALNAYVQGFIVLTGNKGHVVQIPVAIRPVALAAPAEVSGDGSPITYNVKFGYDGAFTATPRGLVPAVTFDGTINTNEALAFDVVVPAGTTYARFQLFDEFTTAPDLDLEVYRGSTLVGSSGSGTSAEIVNFTNPTAATYTVVVVGYDTGGGPAPFTLFTWVLDAVDAGNMTVTAPAAAVLGQTAPVTLDFTGLAAGMKYLGSVVYGGTTGLPLTIVSVDTGAAPAAPAPLNIDLGFSYNPVFLPIVK